MTAARPAIGSPCRSSGGRAVALYPKAPRLCEADPVATRAARRPLAGADSAAGSSTPAPATTFPGSARGPGVAAFKSTVAAPVFNSSNVHGCALPPDASTAQAAAIQQLAAFTEQFPQIVAQLGLTGKRK